MGNLASNPTMPRGERVFHGVVAGVLAVVFIAGFLGVDRWRPTSLAGLVGEGHTTCLLRRATGLPCATCGMTRSFCSIGRADLRAAVAFHPLGPVAFAGFALVMIRSGGIALTGRRWLNRPARVLAWSVPVILAALLAVWAIQLWGLFASGAAAEAWRESVLGGIGRTLP